MVFNAFSSLVQFELRLIQERTRAGLKAARAYGRQGDRKEIGRTTPKVIMTKNIYEDHSMSIDSICKALPISRTSYYRYITL